MKARSMANLLPAYPLTFKPLDGQLTKYTGWSDFICGSVQVMVLQRSCNVLFVPSFPGL
jgi:hypothetical protein